MHRLLVLALVMIFLGAVAGSVVAQELTDTPVAEPKPAASPVVRVSPSPSPAAAAARTDTGTWASLRTIGTFLSSDGTLVTIGIVLSLAAIIAWKMSNRAEATPNEDQLAEMRRFVTDHFAQYVARGLAVEGTGAVAVSRDPAWRKVYLQHLRLHNELYSFRRDIALAIFDEEIDAAVQRELEAARAAGVRANPVVAGS